MAFPLLPYEADRSSDDEETFSIIDKLADAIRIEDDASLVAEDRAKLVQDLYEGPRQCQCCINWIDNLPPNVTITEAEEARNGEASCPLVLRRRVTVGVLKTNAVVHSIEIRHARVREVLCDVFSGLDGIHPDVKYMILLAPFYQFYWRWFALEKAIIDQEDAEVKSILQQLRAIVRTELAAAFAVSQELLSHGVITFQYLWTLFPPGELIYSKMHGADRLYFLQESHLKPARDRAAQPHYDLSCRYLDWNGRCYGYTFQAHYLMFFKGTKKITELLAYPAKYKDNFKTVRQRCIERGSKFSSLAGVHYKAYHVAADAERQAARDTHGAADDKSPSGDPAEEQQQQQRKQQPQQAPPSKSLDRRIILDARRHPDRKGNLEALKPPEQLKCFTGLITQTPLDTPPPGGHRPVPPPGWNGTPRAGRGVPVPPGPDGHYMDPRTMHPHPPPPGRPHQAPGHIRRTSSIDSLSSASSTEDEEDGTNLSDSQLQICNDRVLGYCLKDKDWRKFHVDLVKDVEFNSAPFESLVLPDGYKDLVLSFVESQLKDGEMFDDVINGKGGGLVILLSGEPGVGKTLTAESVAEKIRAPLYKMELGAFIDNDEGQWKGSKAEDEIVEAFDLAARWKAVLLIDECDLYLEKRSDTSAKRNKMVSRFLQELEYYPSMLFLTTNREKVLDPGIYSRIHLTINYPALDTPSRRVIWCNFLGRESAVLSDTDLDALANLDLNGRRIRNITKTARIMAKRAGRDICFKDISDVMWITERTSV